VITAAAGREEIQKSWNLVRSEKAAMLGACRGENSEKKRNSRKKEKKKKRKEKKILRLCNPVMY
jgi:hypothetical protein